MAFENPVRNSELETRKSQGNCKMENGNWKLAPVSNFFRVPNMTKPKELVHGDVPRK
jgi:hypothetical protein